MGSSSNCLVNEIIGQVIKINPERVLDVGFGTGKWGFLIREKFELRECKKKEQFKMIIDCIDIDGRWVNPIHRYIYNDIIIHDIRTYDTLDYDLIIVCDILEHLTKEEGMELVDKLLMCCNYLIISCPFGSISTISQKSESILNEFPNERHKSEWVHTDFINYNVVECKISNPNFMVVLNGSNDNR